MGLQIRIHGLRNITLSHQLCQMPCIIESSVSFAEDNPRMDMIMTGLGKVVL
jgi:hypothetical protein